MGLLMGQLSLPVQHRNPQDRLLKHGAETQAKSASVVWLCPMLS